MIILNKASGCWKFLTTTKDKVFGLIVFIINLLIILHHGPCWSQGWPDIKIRLLPDDSFAVIETDVSNRIRHFPHHDQNGKLDEEQLVYVLGTIDQEKWLNSRNRRNAQNHLEKHYERFKRMTFKRGLSEPININTAKLTQLVSLPQIGPKLAVKILTYRHVHGIYLTIDDIKKVDGIGSGTFNAIRHYITTD